MEEIEPLFQTEGKALSLYRFSLPFNKPINFNGHRLNNREGLWLIEHHSNNELLVGEICPLPGFSTETLEQCEQQILQQLQQPEKPTFSTVSLLPSVSFALFSLQQKIPWQTTSMNAEHQQILPNVPLLQGTPIEIINRYSDLMCPKLVKLKVARLSVNEDVTLLQKLLTLNPNVRFRLDANQRWTVEQYNEFLNRINSESIDYIEEPTASLTDNLTVSARFKVKIGLDESLLTNIQIPTHPTIKALVIKPTLIGYSSRINALLAHAQQQQLMVSISASFESPIAISQLQYLARQWQRAMSLPISLGLDTLHAFPKNINQAAQSLSSFEKVLSTQATCLWRS